MYYTFGQNYLTFGLSPSHFCRLSRPTPWLMDFDGLEPEELLLSAAVSGELSLLSQALACNSLDVNAVDHRGLNAAHLASVYRNAAVLEVLIHETDIDLAAVAPSGDQAIHFATGISSVAEGLARKSVANPACARLLAESGLVDINARHGNGDTPLTCAARDDLIPIVRYLLTLPGVDVVARGFNQMRAIDWAKRNRNDDMVKAISDYARLGRPASRSPRKSPRDPPSPRPSRGTDPILHPRSYVDARLSGVVVVVCFRT